MSQDIFVLIADSDEVDRQVLANLLTTHGYTVMQAVDGESAIKVLEDYEVDVAILAHQMPPHDGFAVAKHIGAQKEKAKIVLTTNDPTTDLLLKAGEFGIGHILQKPIDPMRITAVIKNLTRTKRQRYDHDLKEAKQYSLEDLMGRAIALAAQNAKSVTGGPFGAVVANKDGELIGEGVNGVTSRCDPTAHAEVIAIKRASEVMGSPWLHGCKIFCSAEPTMVAQALIINTGISEVYYALSQEDVSGVRHDHRDILKEMAKPVHDRLIPYKQLGYKDAANVFSSWQQQKDKVMD